MRRTLYWKRLLIVCTVFLVLSGAVFAVHRVQIKSQVSVYREAAERAEADIGSDSAKRGEVIALYAKYLKFRPTDESAYQKYVALLFEQGKAETDPVQAERVVTGVEGFLRAFPAHATERRQLAELYVKSGKFTSARQHIEMLFAAGGGHKSDIELLELAATCEQGLGDLTKAIEYLNAAIKTGTAPVRVYKRALELNFASASDQKNANIAGLLETLLRSPRFENDVAARVAVAQFQRFLGELQNARTNITYALKAPGGADDPDALLAAAELAVAEIKTIQDAPGKLREAEGYLRRARERDPKNLAAGTLLADVLTRQDKKAEGIELLRATAKLFPKVDPDFAMIVDRLIDLGEQTDSAALVEKLAAEPSHKVLVPYYRGRLALIKQDWRTAQPLLEEAAPKVASVRAFHKKVMVGLATCYANVQNPDKQLEYCQKALGDDPNYAFAIIGEAEALSKMGKTEAALRRYRTLVSAFQLFDYRPELVRLELLDVLGQPVEAEVRNWSRFQESLGPVEGRAAEIYVLEADSLVARNQPAEAAKLLRGWLDANPKHAKAASVFVALARVKDGGGTESARSVLDEAESKIGDAVDFRLARAGLLAARPKVPAPDEFEALGAGAAKFPPSEQFRLWYGLGQVAGRVADLQKPAEAQGLRAVAITCLRAAADLKPKDLTCHAALLDHGIAGGNMDVVTRALRDIAEVEGKDGPVGALGHIAIKLPEVSKMADSPLRTAAVRELRDLARRVRDLRPGWGRVFVALAELDMIEGLNDAALTNYTEAIKKGERQEFVIRRAVDLYRTKKQDDDAVGTLNKLSTEIRLPDDLERYRSIRNLLLAQELPKNSRPTIDRIAPVDSKDYRLQLLRGSLLATIREDAEALVAFRRAVELNDQLPETWGGLVSQLIRADKLDDAKRAVAQAEKALTNAPVPPTTEGKAELKIGLGSLHEVVGDLKPALAYYNAAVEIAPRDLNPTRQLVQFFQRTGQMERAEELLNRAKDATTPDVARWARRHLAMTMISRSDAYTLRGKALDLIERNLAVAADDPEDVKARAVIWTLDPVTREKGVEVLRGYGDRGDLAPEEFYLLGRLAFDQGRDKFVQAEKYFRLAARLRPGVTPEHLAAHVRVYLALNRVDLAEAALERLRGNYSNSWEAARETARVLYRKCKDRAILEPDEAKRLLEQARGAIQKFPGWDTGASATLRSGPLFEELGMIADAESLYKKYLAENSSPSAHQALAILYVRQKQPERAIDLAFAHEPKAPVALTARLLTGAVRVKRPDATTEAKVEKWLDGALAKAAGNLEVEASLIGAKAELFDARGEYANAIKEYERAVATFARVAGPKGSNDMVVNNLCMLLALYQPARANDAVKMMTDLIAIRGPVPSFLDTRAVAYLVSSRPEGAIKDLEMALVQFDRPTYHFHLAWAYDLNELEANRALAVGELRKARDAGLTADALHPIELDKYRALLAKYKFPVE
ncbi:tetratricopeptide repeat protein [Gemmata sp. SH-PL17]|uniref:tetratricopeptide repeat protein n=1 Tax=Gemmata sp. SH-PL17 TaxID=1630693 RepID=UPI00078CE350|nr:tetratricopeptide repeat protein [Gemmata sp. SH-PL17]AMV23476.1 tetratricopeptide repeat protein [Gemmata sp. SH-PL17]